MDKWHLKCQGSMEFMALSGVLLFCLIIVLAVVADNTSDINKKKEAVIAEDVINKVQREINIASRMLDGYSRTFTLPQQIANKNYTIIIHSSEVELQSENHFYYRTIPRVVGSLQEGANAINKTNGTIYLN